MEQTLRKQAKIYNRRSKFIKLKVGEKVLLLLPTNANKLLMYWKVRMKWDGVVVSDTESNSGG